MAINHMANVNANQIFNVLGAFALLTMAFTILTPLAIAMKHCRAEKRELKNVKNEGHSLS